MPIYEYFCSGCVRTFDFLVRNRAEHEAPKCPRCGAGSMARTVSRFSSVKSEQSRQDSLADPSGLDGLDEQDPKSMAKWMKKMASQTGENLGPEFDEYCSRLESGEDPEKLEEELGGALGGESGPDDTLYE